MLLKDVDNFTFTFQVFQNYASQACGQLHVYVSSFSKLCFPRMWRISCLRFKFFKIMLLKDVDNFMSTFQVFQN